MSNLIKLIDVFNVKTYSTQNISSKGYIFNKYDITIPKCYRARPNITIYKIKKDLNIISSTGYLLQFKNKYLSKEFKKRYSYLISLVLSDIIHNYMLEKNLTKQSITNIKEVDLSSIKIPYPKREQLDRLYNQIYELEEKIEKLTNQYNKKILWNK